MKTLQTIGYLVGITTVVSQLLASTAADAADVSATIKAVPRAYSGKCPARITFKGVIRAKRAARVRYRFIRSDGAKGPIKRLVFRRPGSKRVGTTWTLGGPRLTAYRGWEQILILAPQRARSKRANFRMRCRAGQPDLVPILGRPMSRKVVVKNIGSGPAGPSRLTLHCRKRGQRGGCPEAKGLNAYKDPAFPNKVVVRVPALRAGQTYIHYLRFWRALRWQRGQSYIFKAKADAANAVAEANEGNNTTGSSLRR